MGGAHVVGHRLRAKSKPNVFWRQVAMAVLTQEDMILIEARRNQKGFEAKRIIKE